MLGVCGRFTSLTPPAELAGFFDSIMVPAEEPGDPGGMVFTEHFNVAPSLPIFVVARGSDGQRKLGRMTWGLVPSWAKERRGSGHVNARSETIAEKPSFRPSIAHQRCLIPMSGYYEWRTVVDPLPAPSVAKAPKRAVYVTRTDGKPLAVAGLWSAWRSTPDGAVIRTCCVITTTANLSLAGIHDRMPVVLEPEDWSVWLGEKAGSRDDGARGTRAALDLLIPADDAVLTIIDVGSLVNSVRHNGPELITNVAEKG